MFKKSIYTVLTVFLVSAVAGLSGCSGSSETQTAKNDNVNQIAKVINSSNVAAAPTAAPSSPVDESVAPTKGGVPENTKPAAPVKAPTPVQGSGGNDFLLFTQVRGALNADNELVTAVIVNIKEGNVVLTGKVSSAAQKAKAEQIVKGVNGVKSVKSELQIH